jgi:26S proteasome regulatory subunit T1
MPAEEQINTASKENKDKEKKEEDKKTPKDEKGMPLTEEDIALFTRYGKGPYNDQLKKVEGEIKDLNQKIDKLMGIKESDLGLSHPTQWKVQEDARNKEQRLIVGRLTQIINPNTPEAKYIVSFKHYGKYVVGLDKDLAATDVEEGMRVGCEDIHTIQTKISIKLPLPPRIDPTVTMM